MCGVFVLGLVYRGNVRAFFHLPRDLLLYHSRKIISICETYNYVIGANNKNTTNLTNDIATN